MNRRSIFTFSTIAALGLALPPSSSVAQQGSLRQQLVGTWTLVSCEAKEAFCVNPNGSYSLDANGRYTMALAAKGRPKTTNTNPGRANVTPEEFKAIALGVVANFGTWSANEADKTVALHIDGALFPNVEGSDVKVSVNLTGDELKLTGGALVATTWRRSK